MKLVATLLQKRKIFFPYFFTFCKTREELQVKLKVVAELELGKHVKLCDFTIVGFALIQLKNTCITEYSFYEKKNC